jgi:hypothetical protein
VAEMNVSPMSKTLFHYTPIFRAVMILREGVILRSKGKTPPYVWLSSNLTNEPTASRAVLTSEQLRRSDARALIAYQGWARFVFDGCDATPWANLRLTPADRRKLKQLAKHKGGRSEEWFALPDDVPCCGLPLETQTLDGRWQETGQDDLKHRYEDLGSSTTTDESSSFGRAGALNGRGFSNWDLQCRSQRPK